MLQLARFLPYRAGAVVTLSLAGAFSLLSGFPAYAQSDDSCPAPTPTAVEIDAVPIVVESTTAEYFVLYVKHDGDGTEVELPVLVKLGEAGTTTLAENVEALPKERYRLEKYLVADPADIDGDCIDDLTELADPVGMNPVNPAATIALSDGTVAIPNQDTFETLAYYEVYIKFILFGLDTDRPRIYFVNTKTYDTHNDFLRAVGLQRSEDMLTGGLDYHPDLVAPDGSRGLYSYRLFPFSTYHHFSLVARAYTVLAASMPLLSDNLAFNARNAILSSLLSDLPSYSDSRVNLVFDIDIYGDTGFLALNPGEGYGLLRSLASGDRANPRDVVIYEALPNDLPRVAGIISTAPQTPLSHVNLRAVQDSVPNAYIPDALDDAAIDALIGSYVRYLVTDDGWTLHAATRAEVDEHYAASRPAGTQTPQRDLSVTTITPLSEIDFDDWQAFGVKAANVAVLRTLGFPAGTVPDGFAIPFYFYDEFMKHNGFYTRIQTLLADSDFQSDFDTQEKELKKLRKDIEDADTPEWIIAAVETMNEGFPEGINRRYRSSTNNEDLPGFSGAGLYSSKSQKPSEDGDDLAKSLKEVYASLWNFRAFVERDFHRIDHKAAAMGILVHPSYQDELVNGVAVSFDPAYGTDGSYYVNSQVGEDLVTNPEAHSVPEEVLLRPDDTYTVVATSNQVASGQLLMTDAQLRQLRDHLFVIHHHFENLYQPAADEPFAMEIEFKITSENILAIKQARPWVFSAPDASTSTVTPVNEAPTITTAGGSATELRQDENRTSRLYTYKASDPEGEAITWSVGGVDGHFFAIDEQGQFSFREDNPPDFELPGDSDGNNVYDVTIQATDDGSNTASLPVTVTVREVNEGPEVTGRTGFTISENQDLAGATYTAIDPEDPGGVMIRWSLTGRDAGDFAIDENGQVTFRNTPDYERPADSGRDNVYEVTVRASDGRNYGHLEVTVTVEDVNEPPTVTGTDTFAFRENDTAILHTFRATDPEGSDVTWSVSGQDGGHFAVYQRMLTLKRIPNFESPVDDDGDNVYEVTVVARDDAFNSGTLDVTVTVSDQNEGPEISGLQSLSFTENQATDRVLASYTATDPENPGASITRWSLTGHDAGDFTIDESGQLTFRNVPDYERPADSGRDNMYEVTVRASDGRLYGYLEVTVTVEDVNEPPAVTGTETFTYRENGTATLHTFRAADPERSVPTWSLQGPDDDHFSIGETGVLAFASPPDHESPTDSGRDNVYEVTVVARDEAFSSGTLDVTVTVTDQNEGPEITGQQGLTFTENQATDRVLATYSATDPEDPGAAITRWSLTGRDAGDFAFDENGQLTFRKVPDYERPVDSGRDNVYNLSVRASDGRVLRLPGGHRDGGGRERASGGDGHRNVQLQGERHGRSVHLPSHRSRTELHHLVAVGYRRRRLRYRRDGRPLLRQFTRLREPGRLGQ